MLSLKTKGKFRPTTSMAHDVFLRHQHIVGGTFARYRKGNFAALACTFERCDFTAMRPRQMTFAGGIDVTRYTECAFDGSKFNRLIEGVARFERCSFLDIEIETFFGHATEFVDCVFSGVIRRSALFGRVSGVYRGMLTRKMNEVSGNSFSRATLIDVDFREGIELSLQDLPTGDDYLYVKDASRRLTLLRQKYLQQPPSQLREELFRFLAQQDEIVCEGQVELFICRSSLVHFSERTIATIWQELGDDSG